MNSASISECAGKLPSNVWGSSGLFAISSHWLSVQEVESLYRVIVSTWIKDCGVCFHRSRIMRPEGMTSPFLGPARRSLDDDG